MIQYCNYDIKGTLATTGTITSGGVITASGGNSSQWNSGYANSITGLSVSGTTTKTLTATQQDGGTLTASWADDSGSNNYLNAVSWNSGTGVITFGRLGLNSLTLDIDGRYVTSSGVTSVNFKTDGTALNVASNTITGSGTMTGIWQGTASEYVNGLGDRVTFPSIPQGDITSVVAGTNLNGGGTSGAVTLNLDAAIELTSVQYGSGVTLSESSDRADLLYINSSTSTWGGLQIGNTSNEFIFSLMGDGNVGGIYDDQNADWLIQWTENSAVRLYFNAGQKLTTTNTGVTITGTASATTFNGALSGNATTATTLQTARTIAGVSFNGSANISLNNNAITNGAGYITSASLPTVNNPTITITTATGLDGATSFTLNQSANKTIALSLDLSELTDMTAGMNTNDEFIVLDSSAERRKRAGEIGLSIFSNDAGFITSSSIPSVGNGTLTVQGTGVLGGSGTFTANQSGNSTISVTHDNSGVSAGSYARATVTVNATGHVTSISANSDANTNYYTTTATFNTGNGIISFSGAGGQPAYSVDIDGRFLPLAGGVMSGKIGRSSAIVGFLEGSYNNVGANGGNTNPIYTIGSSYNPASSTLGNMYGIGYCNATSASFVSLTGASGWGMYVAADGDARIFLDAGNGRISASGTIYASGGNSGQWNTHTSNTGTVTSVGISHAGNAFNTGSAVTTSGTLAITMAGSASQYINGAGNLTTFPGIPQGDITNVTTTSPITGGGSSGSVNISHGSSGVTAATYTAATVTVNATGHVTSASSNTIPSVGNGQIDGRTAGIGLSGSMDATANQSGNTTFTVTSNATTASTGSTLVARDASGDINVRLLRSEYDSTNASIGFIMTQVDTASNNYVRPSTMAQVRSSLNVANGATANTGTISSINATTNGNSLETSNTLTGNGTLTLAWQGNTASYVRGDGSLATFPSIPQGDITNVTAGTGMTGGGSSGSVTLNVIGGDGITANADNIVVDGTVVRTSGTQSIAGAKTFTTTPISVTRSTADSSTYLATTAFVKNQGYTSNVGDITAVTAGTGMTGGGTSGSVTLNVIGGTGITANANDVAVDYAGSDSIVMAAPGGSPPDGDDYMIYGADSSGGGESAKIQFVDIPLSIFDNDAGFSGSGVTAVATSSPLLGGTITSSGTLSILQPISGAWHNGGCPRVNASMEIGRYLDFHTSNTGTSDFDIRLDANGTELNCSGNIRSQGNLEAVGNMVAGYLRTTNGLSYQPSHSFTSDTNTGMYRSASDQIGFSTGGSRRVNISNSTFYVAGNLGVGNGSPLAKLHVDGVSLVRDSDGVGDFYLGNVGSSKYFRFHTNNSETFFGMNCGTIRWREGSSTRFYFYPSTANMTINGTLTQNSDSRVKENVVEIDNCISKVQAMRGVYYNRTDFNTETTKVGVIAQEVEAVLPELILESPDDGLKSVAYAELTAVLINAIKEQQEIIEDLKTRIIKLEK